MHHVKFFKKFTIHSMKKGPISRNQVIHHFHAITPIILLFHKSRPEKGPITPSRQPLGMPLIKWMISFISNTLLNEKPCYKFMLKHYIINYFRQFTKNINICFQINITHRDLVMCNYFWLEQLNVCAKYGILPNKYLRFIG